MRYCGYLHKLGEKSIINTYKKRWFVLREDKIFYYKLESDPISIGHINILEVSKVAPGSRGTSREWVFHLKTKTRTWHLKADSESDMWAWIAHIKSQQVELLTRQNDEIEELEDDPREKRPDPVVNNTNSNNGGSHSNNSGSHSNSSGSHSNSSGSPSNKSGSPSNNSGSHSNSNGSNSNRNGSNSSKNGKKLENGPVLERNKFSRPKSPKKLGFLDRLRADFNEKKEQGRKENKATDLKNEAGCHRTSTRVDIDFEDLAREGRQLQEEHQRQQQQQQEQQEEQKVSSTQENLQMQSRSSSQEDLGKNPEALKNQNHKSSKNSDDNNSDDNGKNNSDSAEERKIQDVKAKEGTQKLKSEKRGKSEKERGNGGKKEEECC